MKEILLEVGGRWDRLKRCYVEEPPERVKILDVEESQVEAVRWFSEWLTRKHLGDRKRERMLMLAGPRRGGKTWLLTIFLACICIDQPNAITYIVSPTLEKREEIEREFKQWIPAGWFRYFGAPQFRFVFVNGSSSKNVSGEIPETLKRGKADAFLINEGQMMSRGVVLGGMPALIDRGGLAFVAANPPQSRKGDWVAKMREGLLETPPKVNGRFIELDPSKNERIDHDARSDVAAFLDLIDPRAKKADNDGLWLPVGARGYFQRQWFTFAEQKPSRRKATVRYWDLAGTSESGKGDYACGVRMSKLIDDGDPIFRKYCVEDVCRIRGTPGDVRAAVKSCAQQDGHDTTIWVEQDPGQAGADQIKSYMAALPGYTVRGRRKGSRGGAKMLGAGPFSTQVQAGQVSVVRAGWTDAYISELEDFPEGVNDDCVDGSSGAFAVLEGDVGWGNFEFTGASGGSRRV